MFRALQHFADVRGRASRSEYWLFVLLRYLLTVGFLVATPFAMRMGDLPWRLFGEARIIVTVLLIFPGLSVTIRRLHDTARSGWWMLLAVPQWLAAMTVFALALGAALLDSNLETDLPKLPHAIMTAPLSEWLEPKALALLAILSAGLICGITLFVFMCLKGTKGPNRFGSDPRAP